MQLYVCFKEYLLSEPIFFGSNESLLCCSAAIIEPSCLDSIAILLYDIVVYEGQVTDKLYKVSSILQDEQDDRREQWTQRCTVILTMSLPNQNPISHISGMYQCKQILADNSYTHVFFRCHNRQFFRKRKTHQGLPHTTMCKIQSPL